MAVLIVLIFSQFSSAARHWVGGQWTPALSLLSVRTEYAIDLKVGRAFFELGLQSGHPLCCQPGFYHVEFSPKLQRVVLTLRKTPSAKFGAKHMSRMLRKSRFVDSAHFLVDPIDRSMAITMYLKKGTNIKTKEMVSRDRRTFLVMYFKR